MLFYVQNLSVKHMQKTRPSKSEENFGVFLFFFTSLARIFGECSTIYSGLRFFKVEINSRRLISVLMPGSFHGGSAS